MKKGDPCLCLSESICQPMGFKVMYTLCVFLHTKAYGGGGGSLCSNTRRSIPPQNPTHHRNPTHPNRSLPFKGAMCHKSSPSSPTVPPHQLTRRLHRSMPPPLGRPVDRPVRSIAGAVHGQLRIHRNEALLARCVNARPGVGGRRNSTPGALWSNDPPTS